MNRLKTLGLLAALALALVIFSAADSASATVLCTNSGCSIDYSAGTKVTSSLKGGTSTRFTAAGSTFTCTGSSISGKTSNTSGTTVTLSIESLSWSGCSQTTDTVKNGSLSIEWISGTSNGTVRGTGSEVTVGFFGISCTYGTGESTHLGTLTGGVEPFLLISATLKKTAGGVFCPTTAVWEAEYVVTEPHALFVGSAGGGGGGGPAPTTLTTSLSGESKSGEAITVNEGAKVKDQATLSGTNASKATGKVSYAVYKDSSCKELVTKAGEFEFKEGKVPASEEKTLEAGAIYYWQASYGGDSSNEASTSTCGKEVLTVKAATSLATSLSGEGKSGEAITVNEGSKVKDTATLSGTKSSTATGKAKYKVYADKECKELVAEAGEVTVSEGKAPASEEKTLTAGAVYYWQANYEGDSLHQASTSTCGKEVLTVKAATTLTTSLAGEGKEGEEIEVEEGTVVTDTATLSGTNSPKATGTVEYSVYSDPKCEELVTEAGKVEVTAGNVPASSEETLPDGIYYWEAIYSGDSLHQAAISVCASEIETVAEETSLTTSLSSEGESGTEIEVEEGTVVTDTATLSGENASEATGSIGYAVYSDSECEKPVAEAGTDVVNEGVVPESGEVMLPAGTYYWEAIYLGDVHNQPSHTCGTEIETVTEPRLTTTLSGEGQSDEEIVVEEEAPVIDTATINQANASTATGTVKYSVYSDPECKELVTNAGEVKVTEGNVPASSEEALPDGIYFWQAFYSGDLTHEAATSICGRAIETMAEETSLATSLTSEGESGTEIEVQEGDVVTGIASLGGANVSEATGGVTYTVYSDNKCEQSAGEAGSATVAEGEVPPSDEVTLSGGTYYWQAAYSGDSHDQESTSVCGAVVEHVAVASLTGSLSGGGYKGPEIELDEETTVTDTATINEENAGTATGTVKYSVYSDFECKELVTSAGEVTVSGGSVPASEEKTLSAGTTYYWQAAYSGDGTHEAATSLCGATVQQQQLPWVVSVGDSFISGEGGRWAGNTHSDAQGNLPIEWGRIDALEGGAYANPLNFEDKGEAIPLCHRSQSAEVFFSFIPKGQFVKGINFACSGSGTVSMNLPGYFGLLNPALQNPWQPAFKPGLDFVRQVGQGQPINNRQVCPNVVCNSQSAMLERFAKERKKNNEAIKMVVVSIGGNDFGFGYVMRRCVAAFLQIKQCSTEPDVEALFEKATAEKREQAIEIGIKNVGQAMANAGFQENEYTILVQDYPSPLPEKNRYPSRWGKQLVGGCPMNDADAAWANQTALKVVNNTVLQAKIDAENNSKFKIRFMDLEDAFNGRRLCEEGLELVGPTWAAPLNPKVPRWQAAGAADVTEWFNQIRLITTTTPAYLQEDLHPNFWAQLALRNCLRQAYNEGTPVGGKCTIAGPGRANPVAIPEEWRPWVPPEPNMQLLK
jgi:hypothetical protein